MLILHYWNPTNVTNDEELQVGLQLKVKLNVCWILMCPEKISVSVQTIDVRTELFTKRIMYQANPFSPPN